MSQSADKPGFAIKLALDADSSGTTATTKAGDKLHQAAAAHNAWTLGSWDDFDKLPADLQQQAWRQLADQAWHHTAETADREGIVGMPPHPPDRPRPQRAWTPLRTPGTNRTLDDIPTEEYVQRLTGHDAHPGRRSNCPLPDHDDHSNDFAAYHGGSFNCFGCNRGGTIFQFAAHLWGIPTPLHGATFREVRDRLHDIFG